MSEREEEEQPFGLGFYLAGLFHTQRGSKLGKEWSVYIAMCHCRHQTNYGTKIIRKAFPYSVLDDISVKMCGWIPVKKAICKTLK